MAEGMKERLKDLRGWARRLLQDIYVLQLAYADPRTPWYAKLWLAIVIGYACSPIDLIPDFIPVLGYLDDVILLPLGIWLAVRLVPDVVLEECRRLPQPARSKNWLAGLVIIGLWCLLAGLVWQIMQH